MEKEKLCLRCMRKIGSNSVCPYCRNEKSAPQKEPYLPLKTVVGGRYLIGKVVDSNGEGHQLLVLTCTLDCVTSNVTYNVHLVKLCHNKKRVINHNKKIQQC